MDENSINNVPVSDSRGMIKKIISRFVMLPFVLGLILLVPADSFKYWEAYLYGFLLISMMFFIILYFLKRDPSFLERRMKMKETQKEQKLVVVGFSLFFIGGFVLACLDHRFGWSDIPVYLVIISDLFVLAGYLFVFFVFRENSYASRVVEVIENQKLITTGLYSIVRHPMYLGIIVMYIFSAPALGSWFAIIPFATVIPLFLVFRIINEEKVLRNELPGYIEYCNKTKFRLIPYIW